jgi:hypothetical protein
MPQFLSTHPTDANRLRRLEAFLPEARKYYVPHHAAPTPPHRARRRERYSAAFRPDQPTPAAGRWVR